MGSKFTEKVIQTLTTFTAIVSFVDFCRKEDTPSLVKVIIILFSIATLVLFLCYKKRYKDTYALLLILSQNNKLHPLRELIMVLDKHNKSRVNNYKFKIGKSIFSYEISSVNKNGSRDVKYKLELQIQLSWIEKTLLIVQYMLNKKLPSLYFYAICENGSPTLECVQVEHITLDNVKLIPATLSGQSGDKSEEFAGLYVCSNLEIPFEIILQHRQIKVLVKYKVDNQIIKNANQYTFVVMPQNYGRTINDAEMVIKGDLKSEPKLQIFLPKYPYFDDARYPNFQRIIAQQYQVPFKPLKKCVYIAQVDL